jgi:hypothetical protein
MSPYHFRLQEMIQQYWAKRGFPHVVVTFAPHGVKTDDTAKISVWPVRSNLRNGLPPGVTAGRLVGR